MARRRYLVAYDIRDDKRLRSVATCVKGYGERIQYSVFICDLNDQELVHLRMDVEARIKPSVDSVMMVDLGRADESTRFTFIGHHEELPRSQAVII